VHSGEAARGAAFARHAWKEHPELLDGEKPTYYYFQYVHLQPVFVFFSIKIGTIALLY